MSLKEKSPFERAVETFNKAKETVSGWFGVNDPYKVEIPNEEEMLEVEDKLSDEHFVEDKKELKILELDNQLSSDFEEILKQIDPNSQAISIVARNIEKALDEYIQTELSLNSDLVVSKDEIQKFFENELKDTNLAKIEVASVSAVMSNNGFQSTVAATQLIAACASNTACRGALIVAGLAYAGKILYEKSEFSKAKDNSDKIIVLYNKKVEKSKEEVHNQEVGSTSSSKMPDPDDNDENSEWKKWAENYAKGRSKKELEKSISSMNKQIEIHKNKIKDIDHIIESNKNKILGDPNEYKIGLLKKWSKELESFENSVKAWEKYINKKY